MIIDEASARSQIATREFLQVARSEGRERLVGEPVRSYVVLTHDVVGSPVLAETIAHRAQGKDYD